MTRKIRAGAFVALGATIALLAGCAGSGSANGGGDTTAAAKNADAKTITWWHNSNTGEGKDYYDQVAKDFEAETGVHVEVSAMQHEDMLTKLAAALQSGDPDQIPDVFMSRVVASSRTRSRPGSRAT